MVLTMAVQNNNNFSEVKKRRLRYRGTHPRRFEEKYKELQGEQYASDIQKVLQRGQTPAGTHRPICLQEILHILDLKPGSVGVDATLGYGGHTQEILKKILPAGKLFGIDVDPIELPKTEQRLRNAGFLENNLIIRRMNFAGLPQLMNEAGQKFNFFLADLGVSSMQIDTPARGFSFKTDGPLDLRLNPQKGLPASEHLKKLSSEELAELFSLNADEPFNEIIADEIVHSNSEIATTKQLASLIDVSLRRKNKSISKEDIKKSQQRVFQALRIFVNDEFTVLDQLLSLLPGCMNPGARIAFLTFHSGEDRRVKKSFQNRLRTGVFKEIARDPVRPSAQERRSNPRSSCAKLRWAIMSDQ
jgi:16S rRNA (cytosine1402-N4)-methyltransferase